MRNCTAERWSTLNCMYSWQLFRLLQYPEDPWKRHVARKNQNRDRVSDSKPRVQKLGCRELGFKVLGFRLWAVPVHVRGTAEVSG